jgi:hypothetical protein
MTTSRRVPVVLLISLCLLLTAACSRAVEARSQAASAGWEALWANDYLKAQQLFEGALAADSDDQSARRGLILAALAQGKDDLMRDGLDDYADRVPSGPFDFFLPGVVQQYSDLDSREHYRILARYAENLGKGKDLPPVDHRMYEALAAQYAYLAGEGGTVEKLAKNLNRIDRWCVLGPFDNTSGSGHRKDHVDTKYVLAAPYRGKFGQSIKWFCPPLVGIDRSVTPIEYFFQTDQTTAYVRTVIDLDRAGTYLVSVGHLGEMEFSINDVVIHEGSRYTGGDEILHWSVDLPEGRSLISFKASNRSDISSVSCGISQMDGSAVSGMSVHPEAEIATPPAASLNAVPVRAGFLAEMDGMLAASPDDEEVQFWNLFRSQTYAEPDSTIALCEELLERFPGSALMRLAVASAYGSVDEDDHREQEINAAAVMSPMLAPAVLYVADQDVEKKRYESARGVAEAVLMRAPECRAALHLRMRCLLNEQKLEELRTAAEGAVKDFKDEAIGYHYLAEYAEARGLSAEEKKHTKNMIKYLPPHTAIVTRYLESAEEEEYRGMEKELKRFLDLAPDSEPLWEAYVRVLLALDKRDKAWDVITESLRSFPQSITLLYYRALFVESGYDFDQSSVAWLFPDGTRTLTNEELELMYPDSQAPTRIISLSNVNAVELWFRAHCNGRAAEILEDALAIDPGSFELRDKIRSLRGKSSYRTFMPDPDLKGILAQKVDPAEHEGEDAVVLTERKRRLAYDEHASVVDYCIAVQVLNEEGIRRWENYSVNINPHANDIVFLESKTIKPDGMEHDAETSVSRVIFTNAEPGDVLFLHYQSTAHVSEALSGNFWDSHLFSFTDPCLESKYVLITPAGMKVQHKLHNEAGYEDAIEHRVQTLDEGFEKNEWCFKDPPSVGREPSAAPARSYLPWLDVTTLESWEEVSDWYADLASGQAEITRNIRQKAAELTEGAASDEERIASVLRFVADDITYQFIPFYQSAQIPREADEVLKDRIGDCKDKCTLMIALLEAAGVEGCTMALVTPWADRRVTYLPSPRFGHVVVSREFPDGTRRWYDPTVRFPDPDQIPRALSGVPALVAGGGMNELIPIDDQPGCGYPREITSDVVLSPDGELEVRRRSAYTHIDETSPRRTHVEAVSTSDLEDEVLAGLAVTCPGAELVSLEMLGVSDPDTSLVYDYTFRTPGLFTTTGDIMSGTLPSDSHLTDAFGAIVAKKERTSPVDLRSLRMCENAVTTMEFPQGYEIVAVPEEREYRFGDCLYSTRYAQSGNTLSVERRTTILGKWVEPAQYPEFKTFLENILQDMRTPILFRKG